jgi:hypothetical protein
MSKVNIRATSGRVKAGDFGVGRRGWIGQELERGLG